MARNKSTENAKAEAAQDQEPELTEDEKLKAEKVASAKASRERKQAAYKAIIDFVKSLEEIPEEITTAIKRVSGMTRASRTNTKRLLVLAYLKENDNTADEMDIFKTFQLGRLEMRIACNELIKKADEPKNRAWVSFDPELGMYSLEAEGVEAPEGWTGYTPVEVDIEEKETEEEEATA